MKIAVVMCRPVVWISPEETIAKAAQVMENFAIHDLPVYKNGQVMGMLSDRDIVIRVLAQGRDPQKTQVLEVMTRGVPWCFDDDDLVPIVKSMEAKCIRKMIVIDHNKKLFGIVSLGDISVCANQKRVAQDLPKISRMNRNRLKKD